MGVVVVVVVAMAAVVVVVHRYIRSWNFGNKVSKFRVVMLIQNQNFFPFKLSAYSINDHYL